MKDASMRRQAWKVRQRRLYNANVGLTSGTAVIKAMEKRRGISLRINFLSQEVQAGTLKAEERDLQ